MKRLFWDIETSPNIGFFWQPGYRVSIPHENIIKERAIICICWKWEGDSRVYSLQWDDGDDKMMVEGFLSIARTADELIAHNGDKFDMKWFNTRCLIHGVIPPEWKTWDTLVIARRRFKFNSNRLDYLGKYLFGKGKVRTDFDMWKDIVLDNCPIAMKQMVAYCKEDVRLLQKVWNKLQPFHKDKTHAGVAMGFERWTCPHDGSANVKTNLKRVTAMGTPQFQMQCKDCGKYYTISGLSHRKYKEAKR